MTTTLKEARETKRQLAAFLNEEFLDQHFVSLEQLIQDPIVFESTISSITKLDKRIRQNPEKIQGITKEINKSLSNLREAVEAEQPQKEIVVKALAEAIGLYAAFYHDACKKTNPFFLSEAVQKTVMFECSPPDCWNQPTIQKEINQLSKKDATPFSIGIASVKFPIALNETKQILSELKVDVAKLQELSQAIEQLNSIVAKNPGLKTLANAVSQMRKSMSNVVRNQGVLGGGNLEAGRTIARANVLYDAMFEFFNQDLKVILGMEELQAAKAQPDETVAKVVGAQGGYSVQKLFAARLQPDHFSGFLKFITGGAKPNISSVLKISSLAADLTNMTYNQLTTLSQDGQSLTPATKIDQSVGPTIQQAAQEQPQSKTGSNAEQILQQLKQLAAQPDGKEKIWQLFSKYAKPEPTEPEAPITIPSPMPV